MVFGVEIAAMATEVAMLDLSQHRTPNGKKTWQNPWHPNAQIPVGVKPVEMGEGKGLEAK